MDNFLQKLKKLVCIVLYGPAILANQIAGKSVRISCHVITRRIIRFHYLDIKFMFVSIAAKTQQIKKNIHSNLFILCCKKSSTIPLSLCRTSTKAVGQTSVSISISIEIFNSFCFLEEKFEENFYHCSSGNGQITKVQV